MPLIIPSAEPFYVPGGPTGCLLVHGFTGTPKEMRWMGEYLAGQGHTVLGVRLAGHATRPEDMLRVRWIDWLANLEDGWNLLRCSTQRIYVVGLSMGGILSLVFAARQPVAGVIAMSTPYALAPDPRLGFVELLSRVKPAVYKGAPDWRDPRIETIHADYPFYPTRSIAQLRDLIVEMQSCLSQITAPALLMHARGDSGGGFFDIDSLPKIYAALGSQHKRMLWIEGSGHVITEDAQHLTVFQAANDFINEINP